MDKISLNLDGKVGSSSNELSNQEVLDNVESLSLVNLEIQDKHVLPKALEDEKKEADRVDVKKTIPACLMKESRSTNGMNSFDQDSLEIHTSDESKLDSLIDSTADASGMFTDNQKTNAALLSPSNSAENCSEIKEPGCLPLSHELISDINQNPPAVLEEASTALHNIEKATQDEGIVNQVPGLIEQLRDYTTSLKKNCVPNEESQPQSHPISAMSDLLKLSFDKNHRNSLGQMGVVQAVGELIKMDHAIHGSDTSDPNCLSLRKYAGKILTNLTLGGSKNQSVLCQIKGFIEVWVSQLRSNDDLRQVTADVLRNLSRHADVYSMGLLDDAYSVILLSKAAMECKREAALKSILRAMLNFVAYRRDTSIFMRLNQQILDTSDALSFLINLLNMKVESKHRPIIENVSGILKNVSYYCLVAYDRQEVLENRTSLYILVSLLNYPSLLVVTNACDTMSSLTKRHKSNKTTLRELGAVPMLRNLMLSEHKKIALGAKAALKGLLTDKEIAKNFLEVQFNFKS